MGGSNHQSNPNRCHSHCPLHRGCPLVGGSIIGGFTVFSLCTTMLREVCFHDDRVVLAIMLCRIHLKGIPRCVANTVNNFYVACT